jgi:hypothetical protein
MKELAKIEELYLRRYLRAHLELACAKTKESFREKITTMADITKPSKKDDSKVNAVADILVSMQKAFNSPRYCEGINKYNVRSIYKEWARKILEAVK